MKVMVVVGTRPEAIKLAPVVFALRRRLSPEEVALVSTGQHREMLDTTLAAFGLTPDLELNVMTPGQTLSGLTAELFRSFGPAVVNARPDWIIVQGDTTTAMVASLVGFYQQVRIGHVEAGLRTENRQQPFPEEINRRIVDLVADAYFAPTWESAENLRRERISDSAIHVTGNTVVDALKWMSQQPYDWNNGPLAAVDRDAPVVLITVHRRESFGAPMNNIVSAIRTLVEEFGGTHQFIWPVHLNPHVRTVVESQLGQVPGLVLLPPLDYASMVQVMKAASLVLTDSGGVQEEAPTFGAPVLVLRETTERPEGVSAGVATLVGTDPGRILTAARMMLRQSPRLTNSERANPYGDGKAAERIADVLIGR